MNETTSCFQPTSQLLGRKASDILTLYLSPKTELSTFCQSLNGEKATIKLFVQNVEDKLIPPSSPVILNMSEETVEFMFQLVMANDSSNKQLTAGQIYDQINAQSFAEYNISVLNIELTGTVETMVFNTKDARNCWDNVTMQYIATTGKESLQINTTPLSCSIPSAVNVTLQYITSTDDDWITVQLIPEPNGQQDYYTSNVSFNHLSTKYYNQTAARYQNDTNRQNFLNMFKNFRKNRDIQFKMVLQTIANGISTQYYVYITNWTSVSGDCFDSYFMYQSRKSITFSMEGNATCPGVTEAQKINGSIVITNGTNAYQNNIEVKGNYFQTAKFLRYILNETWALNTTRLKFYTYLTYYNVSSSSNDIIVITELTRFGIVTKSCFGQINLRLDNGKVCMNINIWDYNITSETSQYNCIARFNKFDSHQKLELYFEKEFLDIQTRNYTFYTYFQTPKATSNIVDFCFTESPPIQPIVPGNFLQRSLLQVKMLHELGNKLSCGIFLNEETVYYIDTVVLEPTPLDLAWVFIPALVAFGIFGLFLFLTLRQK